MKNIKLLLVIALVFVLGITTVYAAGPNPDSSELVVGGKVLFQKGNKTEESLPGATYNVDNYTLTLTGDLNIENGEGIKIIDMGDQFTIIIDGNVNMTLLERNDAMFIINTNVTIDSTNNGSLKASLEEGSGIIVEGNSELHIKNVGLDVTSIRYKEQVVEVLDISKITNTTFYKNNQEEEFPGSTPTTTEPEVDDQVQEPVKKPVFKRKIHLVI